MPSLEAAFVHDHRISVHNSNMENSWRLNFSTNFIIIMSISYVYIDNKVNIHRCKVKYKSQKRITSSTRGYTHNSISRTRWHTSPVQRNSRIFKQRRYIIPKVKNKTSRIATITPNRSSVRNQCVKSRRFLYEKCLMTKSMIDRQFNTLVPKFDSDSFLIGIDNHSSKCISPKLSDFIHPIKPRWFKALYTN